MALLDSLTGLLNRAGFEARLEELHHTQGELNGSAALLYVDLDRFKAVNDTYGHPVGDELLRIFAKRLTNAMRPNDVVARLGGDEFAIVVNDLKDPAHAEVVADKVLAVASADFWIDGHAISIGASIGIAIWKRGASGWKAAVEHADAMLYRAKEAGRGQRAWQPSTWH